jgi:hypothetical protein
MPEEGGKSVEQRLAKLEKQVYWLDIWLTITIVLLGLKWLL